MGFFPSYLPPPSISILFFFVILRERLEVLGVLQRETALQVASKGNGPQNNGSGLACLGGISSMAEHCLGVPSLRRLLFFFIIIIISIKKLLKGAGMSRCVVYNVNLHRVVPGRLDKFMPKSWGMMLQDPNYPIE